MVKEKKFDEVYCSSCGKIIKKEAEICPFCGVRQRGHSQVNKGKSKTAAVLLAVFLSPFNWLYTYKKDKVKFWIALPFEVIATIIIATISLFVPFTMKLGFLISLPFWIWAIVDSSTKGKEWYEKFYEE